MISYKKMAIHLKNNVVQNFTENYIIADELTKGFSDADIRGGVKSFSVFLFKFYDILIKHADDTVTPDEGSLNSREHTNIYADIKNSFTMLYCIGLCGTYDVNSGGLRIDGKNLNKTFRKNRCNKPIEYLCLLQDSGLIFSVDITIKSFNLNTSDIFEVFYPDDKLAPAGLKIMAEAAARTGGNIIYTFARCDYRILALPKKYNYEIRDITKFLTEDEKNFFIKIHDYLILKSCTYESKNIMNEYIFSYTSKIKKAKVFSIVISMDNYYAKLKSKLIREQSDLLSDAPESIKDAVKNGWNCAKINDPHACNPNCIGKNLSFTLDGTEYLKCWILCFNLPVNTESEREYVRKWLEKELE